MPNRDHERNFPVLVFTNPRLKTNRPNPRTLWREVALCALAIVIISLFWRYGA